MQLHPGIPAGTFGDLNPIAAQIAADRDNDPRRKEMEAELWSRKFGRGGADEIVTIYHPLPHDGDES